MSKRRTAGRTPKQRVLIRFPKAYAERMDSGTPGWEWGIFIPYEFANANDQLCGAGRSSQKAWADCWRRIKSAHIPPASRLERTRGK